MSTTFQISSSLLASAVGDAWGNVTEFKKFNTVNRVHYTYPAYALITDDTQMALATIQGLMEADKAGDLSLFLKTPSDSDIANKIRVHIANSYLVWLHDKRNNRAPGNTCLEALRSYEISSRQTGLEGTIAASKGCGANMRNPWLGLLEISEEALIKLSLIQCEITHSHPLALASAVLTALVVKESYSSTKNYPPASPIFFNFVETKTLELIKQEEQHGTPNMAYYEGLQSLYSFWVSRQSHLQNYFNAPFKADICEAMNAQGWVAEEALLLAVAAVDKHFPVLDEILETSVYSNGDSDSIATIAGAIAGSHRAIHLGDLSNKTNNLEADYLQDLLSSASFISQLNRRKFWYTDG